VHGIGIVIGREVISKGSLTIYQYVTIGGGNGKQGRLDGDGIMRGQPLFLGKAVIYTGAIVVGGITVKADSKIKAGSIISSDV
jgi:serine O-acetyltransferase